MEYERKENELDTKKSECKTVKNTASKYLKATSCEKSNGKRLKKISAIFINDKMENIKID